jgi:hypothetical protein
MEEEANGNSSLGGGVGFIRAGAPSAEEQKCAGDERTGVQIPWRVPSMSKLIVP